MMRSVGRSPIVETVARTSCTAPTKTSGSREEALDDGREDHREVGRDEEQEDRDEDLDALLDAAQVQQDQDAEDRELRRRTGSGARSAAGS